MKFSTVAPLAFGLGASAAAIQARQTTQCCFGINVSGGATGPLGQLYDGQNRVGGNYTAASAATYCIKDGGITDKSGRGCILTPPTTQFQCDQGASPSPGFSVSGSGAILNNGTDKFYACPATSTGVYNIYTQPVAGQAACVEVSLSTDKSACASAGLSSSAAPATSSSAAVAASSSKVATSFAPASSSKAATSSAAASSSSAVSSSQPASSSASKAATSAAPAPAPSTVTVTTVVTVPGVCSSTALASASAPVSSASVSSAPATSVKASSAPVSSAPVSSAPATSVKASSAPVSSAPVSSAPVTSVKASSAPVSSAPATSAPATSVKVSSAPASSAPVSSAPATSAKATPAASTSATASVATTPVVSATSAAPKPSASSCPADLSSTVGGNYQYPHLIVPVNASSPKTAYGTQYFGTINKDVSSIFNFDIPASYAGKTCSLLFLFPEKKDLETSDYTVSGAGGLDFKQLSGPATATTDYASAPAVKNDLGTIAAAPGNSYTVASGPCAAGQTVTYEISATGSFDLKYFQDYNPSPLGLYVRVC